MPGFASAPAFAEIDLSGSWASINHEDALERGGGPYPDDWTGLPFVYAIWAVRAGADLGGVETALHEAKRRGSAAVGPIAQHEAPRLGLDAGFCRRYLTNIIRFDLGPREHPDRP